jgi:hypothetical protein
MKETKQPSVERINKMRKKIFFSTEGNSKWTKPGEMKVRRNMQLSQNLC